MKIDVKAMSLREKIGQTIMIQNPQEYVERFGSVEAFLEKYPVGAVYLGSEPAGGPIGESKADSEVLMEFKRCSKYPLLIGGECNNWEEDGQWFAMPKQMALGAADDEELAYQWGRVLGKAARKGGRHWIFGPVADLNLNPNNPVINVRSLSDSPELAERLLTRVVEGIQSCGVAATAKHFPGHGTEDIDPHVARCSSTQTREEWDSTYGRAFGSLIECGLASVMTAHAALECYQSKEEESEGLYKVATLSRDITTGLLKEKMGFKGVVVTDGLIMGGFSGGNTDLEIESFLCGSDVLLWPTLEYMDVLEQKILSGEISEDRLNDAVERVCRLKENTWLYTECEEVNVTSSEVISEVARRSLTLMNNKRELLPVDKAKVKNVLLIIVAALKEDVEKLKKLKDILEQQGIGVTVREDIWIPELKQLEADHDLTIFAISRRPGGTGSIDIYGENAASVWASQAADPQKTIIASFGNPYLYSKYYRHIDTYINAYSTGDETLQAFVESIFGQIPFVGKSPVALL